jgi:Ca-activated chloride channel homolog
MSWGNPLMLLALALPAFGIWLARRAQRQTRPLWPAMRRVSITGGNRVRAAAPRKTRLAYAIMAALSLGVIALARPQWGEHSEQSFSQSREVMIALDLSKSMWTEDMPDQSSRLDAAKAMVGRLLDSLKGENVGLIVFAGTSFVQVPMSPDYQIIREFLPSLDPNYLPKGGSDYSRMLDSALEGFGDTNDRDRYLIVLSDGESSTQGWEKKLPDLFKRDIHVIGVGFGSTKGAFIPDQKGGYLANSRNDAVVSKLTPATMQTLANRTIGRYVAATELAGPDAVHKLLRDTVESGRAGRVGNANASVSTDRFQWFLAPAVLLGLLSLVREFSRRTRPRQIRPNAPASDAGLQSLSGRPALPVAGVVLMVCALAAPRVWAHFDSTAGFDVKETFDSNPSERLRAIAAHLGKMGYDAFDLELLVEATIKYGTDERRLGNPPLKGVVFDAIDAVHEGRKLNAKLGPWDYYEAQLHTLLAPLPVEKQDAKSQNPREANDEEDSGPTVIGNNTQHGGTDSYGEGASNKSDTTVGDLSADDNFTPQPPHGAKPMPPKKVKNASFTQSEGGLNGADDPVLAFSRKSMAAVVKQDSPGRLHQMIAGESKQLNDVQQDW